MSYESRQNNPCDYVFWESRGWPTRPSNWKWVLENSGYYDDDSDEEFEVDEEHEKSRRFNPCDEYFWRYRGWPRRPLNWQYILQISGFYGESASRTVRQEPTPEQTLRSRWLNPADHYFWTSRGWSQKPEDPFGILERSGYYDDPSDDESIGNTSNLESRKKNPCDPYFWKCRNWPRRPLNWKEILEESGWYDEDEDDEDEDEYEDEDDYESEGWYDYYI